MNEHQLQKTEKEMQFVPFGAVDKIKLNVAIIQNFVAVPTKSGKTCGERDAIKFMMMCQAQRLNPFVGDAFLVGYDGKDGPTFSLIPAHQSFLKRAEASADFDGMTSGILLRREDDSIEEREGDFHLRAEAESVVGGWAKVYHKKRSHPTYRRIRMERFNKGFAQWNEDAAGMIVKCAEADALRSAFPTLLGGLFLKEETESSQARVIDTGVAKPVDYKLADMMNLPERVNLAATPTAAAPTLVEQLRENPFPSATHPESTPQTRLESFVVGECGKDFATFAMWAKGTGNLTQDAFDTFTSFSDLPADLCARVTRSPRTMEGLRSGLEMVRGSV